MDLNATFDKESATNLLSLLDFEVLNILPLVMDKVIDRIVPRVIETPKKKTWWTTLQELKKLDDVVESVDNIVELQSVREVDSIRTLDEIDKLQ